MKVAEVITNGADQSIHLPADCHIDTSEVFIKRLGRSLLLIPTDSDPWQLFSQGLNEFTPDYMSDRNQPAEQDRKTTFEDGVE